MVKEKQFFSTHKVLTCLKTVSSLSYSEPRVKKKHPFVSPYSLCWMKLLPETPKNIK